MGWKGESRKVYTSRTAVNSNASVGDVLAYQTRTTGRVWHACIVTKKTGGKIYISQHSGPRKDTLWDNITFSFTDNNVYVIKF